MSIKCRRFAENPLLTPEQIKPSRDDFCVTGVLNAGAFEFDGDFCWLVRVAEAPLQHDPAVLKIPLMDVSGQRPVMLLKTFRRDDPTVDLSDTRLVRTPDEIYIINISHLRMARSKDGHHWTIDDAPLLAPADKYEQFGIEDPRITFMDGEYLITYSAISRHGATSNLVTTRDWKSFTRRGVLFVPDNKDICIFPEKVGGRYVALHRPSVSMLGKPDLWIAFSDDLIHWGGHECVMRVRRGLWDSARIGCGPPPIRTDRGWLEIYHGSDNHSYCLGAVLLDTSDPRKVLARSEKPLLAPEAPYEKKGFFDNVVFANGQVLRPDGTLWIYYGAADRVMAGCEITVREVLKSLERM